MTNLNNKINEILRKVKIVSPKISQYRNFQIVKIKTVKFSYVLLQIVFFGRSFIILGF